jgi:hypothetical protein
MENWLLVKDKLVDPKKDICKQDLKDTVIETVNWEKLAADRYTWRSVENKWLKNF